MDIKVPEVEGLRKEQVGVVHNAGGVAYVYHSAFPRESQEGRR